MKTIQISRIREPRTLGLVLTLFSAVALQAQSLDDIPRARSAPVTDLTPYSARKLPGNLYGVDDRGGYLKFTKPGRAKLVASGGLTMFDMAIRKGTAYYVSSGGYLFRSNLKNFSPAQIGYTGSFNAMDFSPSGKLYAMGPNSNLLYRIDHKTGAATAVLDTGRSTAGDICFVTPSVFLFTSTDNKLVKVNMKKTKNPSKVILNLGSGDWYSMDYRKGQVHLLDHRSGDYYVLRYPGLRGKKVGNIYRNSGITGCNGISFR